MKVWLKALFQALKALSQYKVEQQQRQTEGPPASTKALPARNACFAKKQRLLKSCRIHTVKQSTQALLGSMLQTDRRQHPSPAAIHQLCLRYSE
jgi:hypothetical protein